MTIETVVMAVNFVAGLIIGGLYFFGLWWTVRRLPSLTAPGFWTVASFILRSVMALSLFYLLSQGVLKNLLMCLTGFTLMRLFLVNRLANSSGKRPGSGTAHDGGAGSVISDSIQD
jgi:F1F0 ATPase subunit 2